MRKVNISASEWEMLKSGEQWVLFLDENVCETKEMPRLVLHHAETSEDFGIATVTGNIPVHYNRTNQSTLGDGFYAKIRNEAVKTLYYEWCKRKNLKPNANEGWYKSKKFNDYTRKIGWGNNYIVILTDIESIEPVQTKPV